MVRNILRGRRAPPTVPTDRILPVPYWDINFDTVQLFLLTRFDDVLDTNKLEAALTKLLSRDDWRRVGARLRQNGKGVLEYHIPAEFSKERPAFAYHHEDHQISISDHPVASQIPRPSGSDQPEVVCESAQFVDLMCQDRDPKRLEDYTLSDRPVLGVNIHTFTDATLVSLNWSHVMSDGMGIKAILDAWSLVLQGRDDEVPPLQGTQSDLLETLGTHPSEPYPHANKNMGTWPTVKFGFRVLHDLLWRRSKPVQKLVCVPPAYLKSQRSEALANLKAATEARETDSVPFLSDGDLLCEWQLRCVAKAINARPKKTIWFNNAFEMRKLLTNELFEPNQSYVGNCVCLLPVPFASKGALERPTGEVAVAIRKSVINLGTRAQAEARAALDRKALDKSNRQALIGDSRMHVLANTNWTKGRFYDIDFSAAVVKRGLDHGPGRVGKPSQALPHAILPTIPWFSLVTSVCIVGKDSEGNYWMQVVMSKEQWAKFAEHSESASAEQPLKY